MSWTVTYPVYGGRGMSEALVLPTVHSSEVHRGSVLVGEGLAQQ